MIIAKGHTCLLLELLVNVAVEDESYAMLVCFQEG